MPHPHAQLAGLLGDEQTVSERTTEYLCSGVRAGALQRLWVVSASCVCEPAARFGCACCTAGGPAGR